MSRKYRDLPKSILCRFKGLLQGFFWYLSKLGKMNSLSRCWLLVLGAGLCCNLAAAQEGNATDSKREKAFSIFSVVNFQNTQCRSQDTLSSGTTSNRNGTCFTSSECTTKGGTASGNCASGFGVCCLFKVSSTSATINQNNTYIQNPGFPSVYTATANTLAYKVQKCANNICYLRLDFESFAILGPADSSEVAGGACRDTLILTALTKQSIPTICGSNAGQHIYVDFGLDVADTVTLTFALAGAATTRTWEIKTTQIECSNPSRPPAGCLQYFLTSIGRITTFNFLDTATGNLASQDYSVCIRKSDGFCCVQYQVCADQVGAFTLDTNKLTTTIDSKCTADYIAIPGASGVCSTSNNLYLNSRFCGTYLGVTDTATENIPVCDCTAPFQINVHTNNLADDILIPNIVNRGVCLDYTQLPCTNN